MQQWKQVDAVLNMIEESSAKAAVLQALGTALAQGQQWDRAKAVLIEAEAVVHTIKQSHQKALALSKLGIALVKANQFNQAEAVWITAEAIRIKTQLARSKTREAQRRAKLKLASPQVTR